MNNIFISCPIVPSHSRGTVGQFPTDTQNTGTNSGTTTLKALADKVLLRDSAGTKRGTDFHSLSHTKLRGSGTVIRFPTREAWLEAYEERAAIMEFDGKQSRTDAEKHAYHNFKGETNA